MWWKTSPNFRIEFIHTHTHRPKTAFPFNWRCKFCEKMHQHRYIPKIDHIRLYTRINWAPFFSPFFAFCRLHRGQCTIGRWYKMITLCLLSHPSNNKKCNYTREKEGNRHNNHSSITISVHFPWLCSVWCLVASRLPVWWMYAWKVFCIRIVDRSPANVYVLTTD